MSIPPRHLWRGGGRQAGGEIPFTPDDGARLLAVLPCGLFLEDAQNGAYFWVLIRSKNTFLCLAGCRYKEASSNVRGGLPYVRSHHMSSAADAEDAQNGAYFWVSIRSKNTFFVLGWMQIQGSKLECAWGRTNVRSHHMSSAADAVGAPAKHKNKKKPVMIYSPT